MIGEEKKFQNKALQGHQAHQRPTVGNGRLVRYLFAKRHSW